MSEGIKIPVTPEVKFDPAIFAPFEQAGTRAVGRVIDATNRASKAQQVLGLNIKTTGIQALGAASAVATAQNIMTNATINGTARRITAIQQQTQAMKELAAAAREVSQASQGMGQINIIRNTGGSGGGNKGNNLPTNQLVFGNQISSAMSRGTSNVLGIGREVARGMGFDLDVSNSMQRNLSIGREATQLAIQGQSSDVGKTAGDIEAEARRIALKTGGNVEDIIKALRGFHAYTGDLAKGMQQLENMSASSVAYDTDIKDISSLYAVITKYLGTSGTNEGVDALVRTIAQQGREGAVEIRDQIKQDPKILVNAANFDVSDTAIKAYGGDKRAAQAGIALGMQQNLMGVSAESAQQTGNAMKSFMDTLTQKNAQEGFKKHGVDVFTKDKQTGQKVFKSLEELIPIAVGIAMKDPSFMRDLMPNVRGRKAIQGLSVDARKAYEDSIKSGTSEEQAEKAAMTVALTQLRDSALKFQSQIERSNDVQSFMNSEAGKAAQMQAQMRESMDQATKTIVKSVNDNAPQIESAVKSFAGVISTAAEHPKTAMAVAFAAPALQQIIANSAATYLPAAFSALAPAIAAAGAAAGPLLVGTAIAAAVGSLLLGLQNTDPPDDGVQDVGGGNGADAQQRAEARAALPKSLEDQWANRFSSEGAPQSEGFTGNPEATASNVTVDMDYEKMKQAFSAALKENPPEVNFPNSPNRDSGVSIE